MERIRTLSRTHGRPRVRSGNCQLNPHEQTSVKFYTKYKTFHSRKYIYEYILQKAAILSRGRWEEAR